MGVFRKQVSKPSRKSILAAAISDSRAQRRYFFSEHVSPPFKVATKVRASGNQMPVVNPKLQLI